MGTVAVRVVCVGGGRSMPSFYLFSLYMCVFFVFFFRDTEAVRVVCVGGGRSMPSFYLFSLYMYGFFLFFFARYRPVFTLPASFNALSVGNGIRPFSFFMTAFCSSTFGQHFPKRLIGVENSFHLPLRSWVGGKLNSSRLIGPFIPA